jgi:hypothetical protein
MAAFQVITEGWGAQQLRQHQANKKMTSCWPQRYKTYQKFRDWKHPPQLIAHDRASFYAGKGMTVVSRRSHSNFDFFRFSPHLKGLKVVGR